MPSPVVRLRQPRLPSAIYMRLNVSPSITPMRAISLVKRQVH